MNSSDKQKILKIMKEICLHAYLATCDEDQPIVRPVSPIIEDNLSVWITTFNSSRKVQQIKQNPKVCLAFVEQPNGDRAATIIGQAEIISNIEEKKRIWKLATFDLTQYFPEGPETKEYCLLKINIKKIEWRDSWTGGQKIYEPSREKA